MPELGVLTTIKRMLIALVCSMGSRQWALMDARRQS
jgi:hypothetical protein